MMALTATDLFCGAGGSSSGLVEAGWDVVLAVNHWDRAIQTHAANHPGTEHLCADVTGLDMRRLPRTDLLWASVICTEASPAGGRARSRGQLALLEDGPVSSAGFERTRATALDVVRATEVHRYSIVVVENVPEFATDWDLFGWWVTGMELLGYRHQITSVSSAHISGPGNPAAPQWRNRIYITFTRNGIRAPDLAPRPLARCEECGTDVTARQTWNPGRRVGEYRQQYRYVCPNTACRHATVEPYIRPAATVIDWTDPGTRIGDRPRPLAETTMTKIRAGLTAHRSPLPTRTSNNGEAPCPPGAFVAELRGGGSTHRPVTHPLATIAASGNHHGLVIPYSTTRPLHTISTRDSGALLRTPSPDHTVEVEDAWFRMIQPREQLLAQRFPTDYVVHGNKSEQTLQAGNAVSVNVAHWIGHHIATALDHTPENETRP